MDKFYTVTKVINGKEIKAQFNGIGASLRAVDNCYIEGSSNTSLEKLANYIFENVIVDPRMSVADFGAEKVGYEETKKINGKEYTAKFNGILTAIRAADRSYIEGSENTSSEKYSAYVFEKALVKPEKVTADDFDSVNEFKEVLAFASGVMQGGEVWNEFQEIIAFARDVMQGNFRDEKDGGATRKGSKG